MTALSIYLVRHGETDWNAAGRLQGHNDIPLNDVGREQAADAAERLPRTVRSVVSSDLGRARETAEIVARALGLPVPAIDAGLRERAFGAFEGLTSRECHERFPREWELYRTDPARPIPRGEPHDTFLARIRGAVLAASNAARRDRPAVVVTHGGVVRALLESLFPREGNTAVLVPNGAIYRVEVVEGKLVFAG
jgi:probable phosphoglycerate mutase